MRIDRFFSRPFVLKSMSICIVLLGSHCIADEPDDGITSEMADRWRSVFDEISTSFQVKRNGAPLTDLNKTTVLNLWNDIASRSPAPRVGRVYLWTEHGNPVLIATIFTGELGRETVNIAYEFHSLDSEPLQVEQRQIFLDCPTAGIKWLPLEGIESPKPSRVQRIVQMRDIARSFEVSGTDLVNQTSVNRLLPSPIYRYDSETSLAIDGAIFAFVKSTDPHVYLLIEARNNAWWVAFARSSLITLRIERNNQSFYEFARTYKEASRTPFYIDWGGEQRAANSPETGN